MLLLWLNVLFLAKMLIFLQKTVDITKNKGVLLLEGIFSETIYLCVLMH